MVPCGGVGRRAVTAPDVQRLRSAAEADCFEAGSLTRGVPPPVSPHEAPRDTVWVEVDGAVDCIRYYAAGASGGGTEAALIYLHGDRLRGETPVSYGDNTPWQQQDIADAAHRLTGLPFVLLARPGTYGSSGCHAHRRTARELRVVDAAVRAIRTRYGMARTGLAGQSGGAAVAAYALTQQPDLCCVVLTAGALSMQAIVALDPSSIYDTQMLGLYDPVAHVAEVKAEADRCVVVVASEGDRISPPANQRKYADALARHGHCVHFMWGQGAGEHRHTLDRTGWAVAAWCLNGVPPDQIASRLRAGEVRG